MHDMNDAWLEFAIADDEFQYARHNVRIACTVRLTEPPMQNENSSFAFAANVFV